MNQRHTFCSKIGWWYWLVIVLLFVGVFLSKDFWVATFVFWTIMVYMLSLTFLTRYVVEGDTLTVFYGFFLKKRIPIGAITSIKRSRNPISSPALSLRRLAIRYGKYDEILVSPKDPKAFINALIDKNPNILTDES